MEAQSKVDKTNILGVGVCTYTLEALLAQVDGLLQAGQRLQLAYVNAHALNLAQREWRFCNFLNNADYVFCDGMGVRLAARLLGRAAPPRYTPPDWIDALAILCAARGYRMYFLGARPGVAKLAASRLKAAHQGLDLCGSHHGYFDKQSGSFENTQVVNEINNLSPHVLVVGFGMPTQEYWIADNWLKLDVQLALPVGAMFDYLSGQSWRAPHWMTDNGMEWLGRLVVEPRRLWKRYLLGNPRFVFLVLRQLINERAGKLG